MGKHAPSPPPPPDPVKTAQAQAQYNQQTAEFQSQLNNYNTQGPTGTVNWVQDPTTHQWTQSTQLSPAEQAIFGAQTADMGHALGIAGDQLGNVQAALAQPFNPGNYGHETYGFGSGPVQTGFNPGQQVQGHVGPQDFNQSVNQARDAAYAQQTQYLNPQWQQAAAHEQAQLAAQGLNPNSAAYQNAMQIFGGQENQAYQGAMNAAVAAGNQEQNTLFGQDVAQGQFANTAAGQEYAQNLGQGQFANTAQAQQYGQNMGQANLNNAAQQQAYTQGAYASELPINEFNALMSSGQVSAPTSAFSPTQVAPTDYIGAQSLYQQQLNANYQAQMQSQSGLLGGLFSLGSAAIMASDARLKTDIVRLADGPGFGWYGFRYRGHPGRHVGVIAQEVAGVKPGAVLEHGGVLFVDYGAL